MPKRRDLKKILVIGAGPIVIGQACEFDYSGTQACKALKEEGYKVILINSNPATIMTDPEIADKTYIEPITTKFLESIIRKEKPCAILSTMGGQTALNMTMQLEKKGLLKKYKVKLIGANSKAISNAEDRRKFRKCMKEINIDLPKSAIVTSIKKAKKALKKMIQKQFGNIQEVILQNFEPKPDTRMKSHPSAPQQYFKRVVAMTRIILPEMNIQIPPNLSPNNYKDFLSAGINDWGGISPLTLDYVNPEFSWPQINTLEKKCSEDGFELKARFPVYPEFVGLVNNQLKEQMKTISDNENYVKGEFWR